MKVLLLDGHNLLYRSFTTLPRSITGVDGEPVHGVHGLVSVVIRLIRETDADHVVAAFDVPEVPTFRHKLFPDYQVQRGPLGGADAGDFRRQVGIARHVLSNAGIPALTAPGYEADDIMATLAAQLAAVQANAVVVSADRDLLQLVAAHISILVPSNPIRIFADAAAVRERLGVDPDGIADFKALAGDASDNIPGIAGIGFKSAVDLVNTFGSIESIYEHLADVTPRVHKRLDGWREYALLLRRVVTLVRNLALDVEVSDLPSLQFDSTARARSILELAGV